MVRGMKEQGRPASSPPVRKVEAFRQLLDGFIGRNSAGAPVASSFRLGMYQHLLGGFEKRYREIEKQEIESARSRKVRFEPLLTGMNRALEAHWNRQKKTADDFNLFQVLDLEFDEIRHTKALAWLLNSDPRRKGTHYQRYLGFQAFLDELRGGRYELDPRYAKIPYQVRLEVVGEKSRLDLEIVSPQEFLIAIEVKIWAAEGKDQTGREWKDLCDRVRRMSIPENRVHAFFLTPDRTKAENAKFKSITWYQIARVFKRFADSLGDQPKDVVLFARHCARMMERFSFDQPDMKEE